MSLFLIHCLVCHSFPPKEQVSLNFMAAVTICIDFWVQEKKICHCFHFSPPICHEVMEPDAMIFIFECWVLSQLFHSLLSPSSMTNLESVLKSKDVTFFHKGLYSQSYGFYRSHAQVWELDHKEGWVPKNWYFWTVVLEKTLRVPWLARGLLQWLRE